MEVPAEGVQVLTRPSESVVAWNVIGSWLPDGDDGEERRVSVTGRFAAGVPVSVLSTWQVMGSRVIVVIVIEVDMVVEAGAAGGGGSAVRTGEDGSSWCW